MRGLQYDLWTMCPPRLGQKIFGEILQESLQILGQRYAHAKPSYKRIPQFRYFKDSYRNFEFFILCL